MKIKKIIESVVVGSLTLAFYIFLVCFLVSAIILVFKYAFYTESGLLNILNNENITSVLIIVLTFVFGVSLIFYKFIDADIKRKSAKDFKKERNLSSADSRICLGFFHMHIYKIFHNQATKSGDVNGKVKGEIDASISQVRKAIEYLDDIEEKGGKEYFNIICLAKNNLAYYLARKWNYYKDGKDNDFLKEYLSEERNSELAREYIADKEVAKECIDYLKKVNALGKFPKMATNLADTFEWVKNSFSIEIDVKSLL